jgi:hypothetical protein
MSGTLTLAIRLSRRFLFGQQIPVDMMISMAVVMARRTTENHEFEIFL